MDIEKFYLEKCLQHLKDENMVWLETESKLIEVSKKNKNRQSLMMENLIRYASPKTDINKLFFESYEVESADDDFDSVLSEVETDSQPYKQNLKENTHLYFLPTHLEKVIKNIVCAGQRRRIPSVLSKYIPVDVSDSLKLKYLEDDEVKEEIINNQTPDYGTSFYKVFLDDEDTECDLNQIQQKVSYIRKKLNAHFLEVFDYYFVGCIPVVSGLIQKGEKVTYPIPRTFHYDFWFLNNSVPLDQIVSEFKPYPFVDELVESEVKKNER